MTIKTDDINALVEQFTSSGWDELHVEIDGLQLFLSTDPDARLVHGSADHAPTGLATAAPMSRTAPAAPAFVAASSASGQSAEPANEGIPGNWRAVTAPNLGTFYRSPKPGAVPYVEVDQSVTGDTEVCLLEVMKLFTAVRAGAAGIVRRICVEDGQMVEHGQALFYIEPA